MKRITTISLALFLGASAYADTLKILGEGGTPGFDEPQFMAITISPDGKYAAGAIELGDGMFVADIDNNIYQYAVTQDEKEGALLVSVDNQGTGVGYDGPGVSYNIDGVRRVLAPAKDHVFLSNGDVDTREYKSFIGEGITPDGSLIVGSLVAKGNVTYGAYTTDGGETFVVLPMPSEELTKKFGPGNSAKHVSVDGKYILGFVASYRVGMLWERNDKGVYEVVPLAEKFCVMNESELLQGKKRLLSLFTMDLSPNGKYALFRSIILDDNDNYKTVPAVYNTWTGEMKIYDEKQEIDEEYNAGLAPSAIADNGTFIGTLGVLSVNNCFSFIMYAGETQAKLFVDEFPNFNAMFGHGEQYGFNIPASMSASGSRILGYFYYSDDYNNLSTPAYYVSYVIEREVNEVEPSGIETAAVSAEAEPVEYFTVDGRRISRPTEGLNIIRMSDGSVRKVMK